jgi:hypothetical protein
MGTPSRSPNFEEHDQLFPVVELLGIEEGRDQVTASPISDLNSSRNPCVRRCGDPSHPAWPQGGHLRHSCHGTRDALPTPDRESSTSRRTHMGENHDQPPRGNGAGKARASKSIGHLSLKKTAG